MQVLALLYLFACGSGEDADSADAADTADTDTDDTDTDTDTDETELDGAALFTGTCAPCHGADGRGTGEYPDITGEMDLTDEEILRIIVEGKEDMPPQALTEAQAQAVIAWMRATF